MEKSKIIKGAAHILTGAGVAKTVDLVVQNNLPSGMKWYTRALTFIGTSVLSSFISAKMSEYVEDEIDQLKDQLDEFNKALTKTSITVEEETE